MSGKELVKKQEAQFSTILQGADKDLKKDIIKRIKQKVDDDPRFRGTWDECMQLGDMELLDVAVIKIYEELVSGEDLDPRKLNALERLIRAKGDIIKSLFPKVEKKLHLHMGEEKFISMGVGGDTVDAEFEVKE